MTSWEKRSERAVEPKKSLENPADRRSFRSMGRQQDGRPCSVDTEVLLDEVCAAFENTVDTVISVDISRRIRAINHPPDGMSITDVLGVDVVSYVNPAYQGMVRTMIGDVFASGEPGCYEIQDNGSEDAESWNETRLIRFGKNTASRRVLLITHDITRNNELEKQTRRLEKEESLRCMAAAIAHRYNNLLAVVMGNLELAMDDLPKEFPAHHEMSQAMEATNSAAKLGALLLTSLGQTFVTHEPINLVETCRLYLPTLRSDIPKNITLKDTLSSPVTPIMANTDHIKQILDILIVNAREALDDHIGTISLSIESVYPEKLSPIHQFPASFKPGTIRYACLAVRDEAGGIEERDIEKIFDPFFSTKFIGRGLGLAVARGIVDAAGGCITVESKVGMGSVFRVYLPLTTKAVALSPLIPRQEATCWDESSVVLLVDDEQMVRDIGVEMLKYLGFEVVAAKDGGEAVKLLQGHHDEICCILCDLTMPRMNGWETLKALRRIVPGIPAILASGYSQPEVLGSANHSERFQAFLGKPYQMADLKAALAKCWRKSILTSAN